MQNEIGPLLHRVASELDQVSNQVLEERLGIGLSQFRILLALEEKTRAVQKEIAEILGQTEASISRQLKIMSKKGLIEVKKNASNRRERNVFLSSKGEKTTLDGTELLNEYHAPLFAQFG